MTRSLKNSGSVFLGPNLDTSTPHPNPHLVSMCDWNGDRWMVLKQWFSKSGLCSSNPSVTC